MTTQHEAIQRSAVQRLLTGANSLRHRIGSAFNRGQLGPSAGRELQQFVPGR